VAVGGKQNKVIIKRLQLISRNQRGFTLVEILVAMAIGGLIMGGITTTIFQALTLPAKSNNQMTAVKQVENSINWIRHDAVQAQIMETSGDTGFPLRLTWVDWNNTEYEVTYSLQEGKLERKYVTHDRDGTEVDNQTSVIAEDIDTNSEMTYCQVDGSTLTLKITATITGYRISSETRLVEILARPAV
jgi:prepilin-type N-terminal cleavage/methylation domain-containing protein